MIQNPEKPAQVETPPASPARVCSWCGCDRPVLPEPTMEERLAWQRENLPAIIGG